MMKLMRMGSHAFTLVELLVVIAIIGVLAALMFPAMGMAKAHSENSQCVSNLRQIGIGFIAFAGENEGSFPEAGAAISMGSIDPTTGKPSWAAQILPYIGNATNIFRCPAGARKLPCNAQFSYFIGAHAAYEANGGFAAVRTILIPSPSKFILAGDNTWAGFSSSDADKDDYTYNAPFGGTPPHSGYCNILFADGSVRAYKQFDSLEMQISYTNPAATY